MPSPRALRQIGSFILIIGLLGAAAIYWSARRQEMRAAMKISSANDGSDVSLSPDDSKVYTRNTVINEGKSAMLIERFLHFLGQLFQGRPLAFVVAIAAVVVGFSCFALADHLSHPG